MHTYIIEKIISNNNTMNDMNMLTELITNSESVHKILGELFSVGTENDWRSKNNILYRKVMNSTCKFIVQSDIEIDMNQAKKLGFSVNKVDKTVKNGDVITIELAVSPFRKNGENKNRTVIKTTEERIEWLKNKLSHNDECEVIEITEMNEIMNYMAHSEDAKGSAMLLGRDYQAKIRIKDAEAFNQIRRSGIGPCKNYGFGLINVV